MKSYFIPFNQKTNAENYRRRRDQGKYTVEENLLTPISEGTEKDLDKFDELNERQKWIRTIKSFLFQSRYTKRQIELENNIESKPQQRRIYFMSLAHNNFFL